MVAKNLHWWKRDEIAVQQIHLFKKMITLDRPYGVFVSNGEVHIADTSSQRVRKVLRNGQIVTIAGTGTQGYNGDDQLATNAQLIFPISVIVSSSDQVYISEMYGHRIRKIAMAKL